MKKRKIMDRIKASFASMKSNPDAFKSGLLSLIIPGLGQFRNKQKVKAAVFLGVFFLFILIEFATGGYVYIFTELSQYPGDKIYLIRDYGGMFSKGLWGLFTLGRVTAQTMYRGQLVTAFNKIIPWLSADNSVTLLGNGLIALVLLSLYIGVWVTSIRDAFTSRITILNTGVVETGKQYIKRIWVEMFPFIILLPTYKGNHQATFVKTKGIAINAYTKYQSAAHELARLMYSKAGFQAMVDNTAYPPSLKDGSALVPTLTAGGVQEQMMKGFLYSASEYTGTLPNNPNQTAMGAAYYQSFLNDCQISIWDGTKTIDQAIADLVTVSNAALAAANVAP